MAEKMNFCKCVCGCLSCLCTLFVLIVVLVFVLGFGSVLLILQDRAACSTIANKQPYLMRIENVTLQIGSPAKVDCKILNFGLVDKVSWTSSKFEAEIGHLSQFPTTLKTQYGVSTIGGSTEETFYCQAEPKINGTITLELKTFTLSFNPVFLEHEGFYTCRTTFTVDTPSFAIDGQLLIPGQEYSINREFYLSVK